MSSNLKVGDQVEWIYDSPAFLDLLKKGNRYTVLTVNNNEFTLDCGHPKIWFWYDHQFKHYPKSKSIDYLAITKEVIGG